MEATNLIEIILLDLETNNSKVFKLIDDRLIDYSDIYVENSLFMNHEQGYEMYMKPRGTIIFNNMEFIAFSIDFGTSINAVSDSRRRVRNRNLLSTNHNERRMSEENDLTFSPTKMSLEINETHAPTTASPTVHPTPSPTSASVADGIDSQVYFSDFKIL